MSLSPGQVIENHYRIDTLLGQGGMGAVYRGIDLRFSAPVSPRQLWAWRWGRPVLTWPFRYPCPK
jgi:hypothetical protein